MVDLNVQRKRHVMTQHLESRIGQQMADIGTPASKEIINAYNLVPILEQTFAEM
jgi:hypothetical protein